MCGKGFEGSAFGQDDDIVRIRRQHYFGARGAVRTGCAGAPRIRVLAFLCVGKVAVLLETIHHLGPSYSRAEELIPLQDAKVRD